LPPSSSIFKGEILITLKMEKGGLNELT
jgi:hypothetical protein